MAQEREQQGVLLTMCEDIFLPAFLVCRCVCIIAGDGTEPRKDMINEEKGKRAKYSIKSVFRLSFHSSSPILFASASEFRSMNRVSFRL